MESDTPKTIGMLTAFCGVAALVPCIFFLLYTVRLIYVNVMLPDAAEHRTGGMLIGAIVFPLASVFFGIVSWRCIRRGLRAFTNK